MAKGHRHPAINRPGHPARRSGGFIGDFPGAAHSPGFVAEVAAAARERHHHRARRRILAQGRSAFEDPGPKSPRDITTRHPHDPCHPPRQRRPAGRGCRRAHPRRAAHLPAVRGLLRPQPHGVGHRRAGARGGDPGRRAGRVQPRLPVPQGGGAEGSGGRPRPAAPAAGQARRSLRGSHVGRGACRDRAPPAAAACGARPRRAGVHAGQPQRAPAGPGALRAAPAAGGRFAQRVQRVHAGPDAAPAGQRLDVRPSADGAGARHRPLRFPVDPGRQPHGQQQQHVDGARLPRPRQGPARPRRPAGGGRPASQRDGRGRRRAPFHPPRHRPVSCCWAC